MATVQTLKPRRWNPLRVMVPVVRRKLVNALPTSSDVFADCERFVFFAVDFEVILNLRWETLHRIILRIRPLLLGY